MSVLNAWAVAPAGGINTGESLSQLNQGPVQFSTLDRYVPAPGRLNATSK